VDLSAFVALAEDCAPPVDIPPLIEIVRAASGFEPLSLTIDGHSPIKILATSKDEAIALAMQTKVGKQHVRLGLVGLTFADLDKTGVGVADAFEACPSLRAATQILNDDPRHFSKQQASAVLSAAGAKLPLDHTSYHREERPTPRGGPALTESHETPKKRWDVFGDDFGKSLLVYQAFRSPR
jgi:type IV secretion system protein VirB1